MLNRLPSNLLTTGELAKLAHTTNRTVRWYIHKGIISPHSSNEKGYRFYTPEQVVDMQVLLLMRKFGFSLKEMKEFASEKSLLKKFLSKQRENLKKEVSELNKSIEDIDKYYLNIRKNGTLIDPIIKTVGPLKIIYIEKNGPYNKIEDYFDELQNYLENIPDNPTFVTIFIENEFKPKRAKMKIGLITDEKTKIKYDSTKIIRQETIPKLKSLTYGYNGPANFVSLLWQEMLKYMEAKNIKINETLPFANMETSKINKQGDLEFELIWPII